MFYYIDSSGEPHFFSELWIFIPMAISLNLLVYYKRCVNRKRRREFEKLLRKIENHQRLKKILFVSLGVNAYSLFLRGGTDSELVNDFVDVEYIRNKCIIQDGISFLDHERLRNLVHSLYSYKRTGKIIYVTATVLCSIAQIWGDKGLALPFAVGFFGTTDKYYAARAFIGSVFWGITGIIWQINLNPFTLVIGFFLGT